MSYRNPLNAFSAIEEVTEDVASDIMDNAGWEWVWIDDMIAFESDGEGFMDDEYSIGSDDENLSDTLGDLGFLASLPEWTDDDT